MDKRLVIYDQGSELDQPDKVTDRLLSCAEFSAVLKAKVVYTLVNDFNRLRKSCRRNGYDVITYSLDTLGGWGHMLTLNEDGIDVYFIDGISTEESLLPDGLRRI